MDLSFYGLSTEALAQGRWWTLVSHAFLPVPVTVVIWVGVAFFILGLTPTMASNPGWLGGWRPLAAFVVATIAGALAQLSLTPSATVSGPWAGLAGLAVYLIFAKVFVPLHEPQSLPSHDMLPVQSQATGEASIYLLTGPICLAILVSLLTDEFVSLAGRLVVGGAIVALGVLAFVCLNLGGSPRLERIGARLGQLLLLMVLVVGVAVALRDVDFGAMAAAVVALPWTGYLAGAAVGLIAGLVERRTAAAR